MKVRECNHVQFLSNARQWPRWPVCPVKNKRDAIKREAGVQDSSFPALGVVLAPSDVRPPFVVYLLNMGEVSAKAVSTCKRFEYESFDEMVAAGWEVD